MLTLWRNKLRGSDAPERIFDAVRAGRGRDGGVGGQDRRALDSTLLDDAVATQDTVTQLVSMIRRVRAAITAAAEVTVTAHDYDRGGKAGVRVGRPRRPQRAGVTAWSTTPWRSWPPSRTSTSTTTRRSWSRCWRWSPAKTSSPTRRARWRVAHRRAGREGSGDLHGRSRDPPHAQVEVELPRRLQGPRRGRARHRDHHRLRPDPGQRR